MKAELRIDLDPSADPADLVDSSLNLFDWTGEGSFREFHTITIPNRLQTDLSALYETGEVLITSVLVDPISPGDFNGDVTLDVKDIDELAARVRVSSGDLYYDVDADGQISENDIAVWVEGLKGTQLGDTDLNGSVDFEDFLVLSEHFGTAGGWGDGDFTGDGRVDFSDFLALSVNFGGANAEFVTIPEPTAYRVALFSIVGIFAFRRQRGYARVSRSFNGEP